MSVTLQNAIETINNLNKTTQTMSDTVNKQEILMDCT